MTSIKHSLEYRLISAHYSDRVAERSRVPLINHIDDGLVILNSISASDESKRAYCLHPLLQNDDDLRLNYTLVSSCDTRVVLYAMEYRNIANNWLSDKANCHYPPRLSPISDVNDMLVADKVQNRKDFITYHQGTHPRRDELTKYFDRWLLALGISETTYQNLCEKVDNARSYA